MRTMQESHGATRWCLPAAILLVVMLAAPADASCQNLCKNIPKPGGGSLTCSITPDTYSGNRLPGKDSFTYSCLGDAGKDCADKANAVDPSNTAKTCCGCYLYAKYCAGKAGFVTNTNGLAKHTMIMPANPCTGVEHHNKGGCPGETIWSEGYRLLQGAGQQYTYGMSINPVGRRSEHQMHVHLAEVKKTLRDAIEKFNSKGLTKGCIDCGGHPTLGQCDVVTGACDADKHLTVHIFSGISDPAAAKPFETVYTSNPQGHNGKANVEQASALVMHVPNAHQKFAVLSNPRGPAESMMDL